MDTNEYVVLSPIKILGEEIPKDQRPAPLKGQRQRTHEFKIVDSGVVSLSEEEAAPLLEARALRLASDNLTTLHDPAVVGFEGQSEKGLVGANPAPGLTVPDDGSHGRDELLSAGYLSDEEVRFASDEELLAVDGIGSAKLGKIRAYLEAQSGA